MKLILLLIALCGTFFFSGCMVLDRGFTPNKPVACYDVGADKQIDITYDVQVSSYNLASFERHSIQDRLRERIDEALKETRLYRSVKQASLPGMNCRHYVFHFQCWTTNPGLQALLGFCSGLDFCLIPVYVERTLDGSVTVFENGQRVRSDGTAEVVQATFWLPLLPVGVFLNDFVANASLERGVVHALVNKASETSLH